MTAASGKNYYTRAEVAQRNGKNVSTLWIIYKNGVYDVTNYIHEHPGGDVILEEAGKDTTKAFNESGHSTDAMTVLAKLQIGLVAESEQLYDENGKKKKKVVSAPSEEPSGRSCLSICTCGLL